MLRAGVPLLRVFEILGSQTENPRLRRIVTEVAREIREGSNLHNALRKHASVFPPLYCSMVQAGEASGALPLVLERLIYIIGHEHKVKSDIRSALQYPIMVIVVLGAAFTVLLTFVVPKFGTFFGSAGIKLPLPTLICLAMNDFLRAHWLPLLFVIALVVGFLAIAFRTPGGRFWRDAAFLRMPIVGKLLQKTAVSRFSSIFSILQSTGVGILESMDILSGTIGNAAISRELENVRERLEEGQGIAKPLASAKHFTPMLVNMVAIGEESGSLGDMLSEVSQHYDTEVEYATKRMADAIGPILIIVLAAMVGFFALAIYLPMWDLSRVASGQ